MFELSVSASQSVVTESPSITPTRAAASAADPRAEIPASVEGHFAKQNITIALPHRSEWDGIDSVSNSHSLIHDRAKVVCFLVNAHDVHRMKIEPLNIEARVGDRRYTHAPLAVVEHRGRKTIIDVEDHTLNGGLLKEIVRVAGLVLNFDVITIGTRFLHTSSYLSSVSQIASNAKCPIFEDDVAAIEVLMARCHIASRPVTVGMAVMALGGNQSARRKMHALIARDYLRLRAGERLAHHGLLTAGAALGT